jgi:DNA-binding response OmpR family regulator
MPTNVPESRIAIVSDNDRLAQALEMALNKRWQVVRLATPAHASAASANAQLIIVALSLPSSEPIVTLARASLAEHIGRVPILVISEKPFRSDPQAKITHLDFPYSIERLYLRVAQALQPELIAALAA